MNRIFSRLLEEPITNEEKRIAIALYEKYSDVFDSIYDVLVSSGVIDYSTSELRPSGGRASGRLAVRIGKKVFSQETIRLLFQDVLKYLADQKILEKLPMPWGTSKQRYIISNEKPPTHPNGREFFYPVKYEDYAMESHYDRQRGLKILSDLCKKLEIDFEIIDT